MKLKDPPVNKYSRVCGAHFLDEDYTLKGTFQDGVFTQVKTSMLKDTAVPSVFDFTNYQTHPQRHKTPRGKRYNDRSELSAKKQARKVQYLKDYFDLLISSSITDKISQVNYMVIKTPPVQIMTHTTGLCWGSDFQARYY